MTTTKPLTLVKIEDHEGDGSCSACGREGLRWIATLSDGSKVGIECSKKILGFRPATNTYNWVPDFTAVAEHRNGNLTHVLWRHKSSTDTRETVNGSLTIIGGVIGEWTKRGWATS